MRKILDRVTITGADDSIQPYSLLPLSEQFPFAEWGILLSKTSAGRNRFPSVAWIDLLPQGLNLSAHICGRWVREICDGSWSIMECDEWKDRPGILDKFSRFQINFHGEKQKFLGLIKGLQHPLFAGKQIILQIDGVNDYLLEAAREAGIDAVPLFDKSGGIGVLPDAWPKAMDCYSGYAGGLSPSNLELQLELIEKVCGNNPIWIDVETKVRSADDRQFETHLAHKFLEIAKSWLVD